MDGRNPYVPDGFGGGSEGTAREVPARLHRRGNACMRQAVAHRGESPAMKDGAI